MAEYTTILDRLEIMMRLGIHPHEVAPQRVVVSVEMTVVYPAPPRDLIDPAVPAIGAMLCGSSCCRC